APPLPAAGGIPGCTGRVRSRERDPALHWLGGDLEADRGDPDRLRAPGALDPDRYESADAVVRLAQCRLALAVSARHGHDLVPQLVRSAHTELDPPPPP